MSNPKEASFTTERITGGARLDSKLEVAIAKVARPVLTSIYLRESSFDLDRTIGLLNANLAMDTRTVLTLLYVSNNQNPQRRELAGFSFAYPMVSLCPAATIGSLRNLINLIPSDKQPHTDEERSAFEKSVFDVGMTLIAEENRHQGGWSMMMDDIDSSILKSGGRRQMRTARTAENYAEHVARRYEARGGLILAQKDVSGTIGTQKQYLIEMAK